LGDASAGGFAYPSGLERIHEVEQFQTARGTELDRANVVMLAVLEHPESPPPVPRGATTEEQRAALEDWAKPHYDSDDRDAISAASGEAVNAFRPG
jgi:hypothetical protein